MTQFEIRKSDTDNTYKIVVWTPAIAYSPVNTTQYDCKTHKKFETREAAERSLKAIARSKGLEIETLMDRPWRTKEA
jgi:hypothetical protein